jgi:hypothetical protein
MCWQAITAVATSLTVLAILGGAIMMHLLSKPKVNVVEISPIGWFNIFKEGKEVTGARITIKLRLENNGGESTSIKASFILGDGRIFDTIEDVLLHGHGTNLSTVICLELLKGKGLIPVSGKDLKGDLILKPWGNRRLGVGKKEIRIRDVVIPENQAERAG